MSEFRLEYGQRVQTFLGLLCHTKGKWAGQPFRLLQWQKDAIDLFYSTLEPDEDGQLVRAYQYLYEEIPKKNGKTELAAGLGLYHLLADGEQSPEVYLCAADKDNAGICFNAILYMIDNVPALAKLKRTGKLKVIESQRRILYRPNGGLLRVLSSDGYSKHGYSPSCVIFDELHAQKKRELWDIMTGAAGSARRQPVWIILTTAGDDPDRRSIGWEIHEKCRRIRALRAGQPESETDVDDPLWLPIMCGISTLTGDDPERIEALDIYDEGLWALCNPSLGQTVSLRTLRQEARTAKTSEAAERLFRWLRLNQWIATKSVGWLPLTLYDRTQWHVPELEAQGLKGNALRRAMRETLRGKRCFGGLDLSSTTDLSALVLYFPAQPGLSKAVALFWAWRPRVGVTEAENRDHVPYQDWERAEYLRLCEGDMVDYEDIKATVLDCARRYRLHSLGVDPYLSRMLSAQLMDAGISVIEIPQNMTSLSPAMKATERELRAGELVHEHNTCARWCFGNVRCATDGNENIKPMKNRSTGRIDIAVAWIIAKATAMLAPTDTLAEQLEAGAFTF